MERKTTGWGIAVLALGLAALTPCSARAQLGAGGGSTAATQGPNFFANPYATPYANPFLNPYMMQMNTTPQNAALYFFAAQGASGGIGSGQLSGVRPGPGTPGRRTSRAAAPQEKRAPSAPGVPSSVARYFNRGSQSAGTGTHFNRPGSYYPQNRR